MNAPEHVLSAAVSEATWEDAVRAAGERLLQRTFAVVSGLADGEAGLISRPVCLISDHADDLLFARLLTCFGAQVTFVCAEAPRWRPGWHPAIVDYVTDYLERNRPNLALGGLQIMDGQLAP